MNLQGRLSQVSLFDRIVSFPHLFRLMPNNFHSSCGVHSCSPEIRRCAVPKIMESKIRETGIPQCGLKRSTDAFDRASFISEDMPGGQASRPPNPL